ITNKPYSISETFIKAQIDFLPFQLEHFWGAKMPFEYHKKRTIRNRITSKIRQIFSESKESIITREFQKRKIKVVLAHYGMIGVEILPVCQNLNIPLLVHFHGHDAVRKTVLVRNQAGYKQIFSYPK